MAKIVQDPGVGLITIPGREELGPLRFFPTSVEITMRRPTPIDVSFMGGRTYKGYIEPQSAEIQVGGIVTGNPFEEIEAKRHILAGFTVEELLTEIRIRIMDGTNVREEIGPSPSKAVRKRKKR